QGGLPTPIVNRARVDNASQFAGADPQPANNAASVSTAVKDTTPPALTLSATPSVLWPPNHQFVPVTIAVTSTDVCDTNPAIRLVSITSNETPDAKGSGNTSPDVRGAAFGTDDRQFELRAERSGGIAWRATANQMWWLLTTPEMPLAIEPCSTFPLPDPSPKPTAA